MLEIIKGRLIRFDYVILLIIIIFGVISFFSIYSAVYDTATDTVQSHPFRQARFYMIGFAAYLFISLVGYRWFVQFALPLYVLGCALLVFVMLKGVVGMGAQRWIYIGSFSVQPSEIFKFVWVLTLGWVFSDIEPRPLGFLKLSVKALWLIPPTLMVFLQPDLGTALTYVAVWACVVLFLGIKRFVAVIILLSVLLSAPIVWNNMKDYQKMRVITFVNPDKHSGKGGYQAIQSRIAIGSGGLMGKGYLKGTQSHLRFMPERHTDFIYAVINEEFGLMGGGFIILLFFVLITRIIMIAVNLKEAQGKVMCIGVAGLILFQFYVNISMTLGIAPVVGVPLPFISYGGSSLLAFIAMLGLVNSAHISKSERL